MKLANIPINNIITSYAALGIKTVIDYGAKVYGTKSEALNGESFHEAGNAMLLDTGVCLLPPYGWLKLDDTLILQNPGDCVKSLGYGNKGLNIVADMPISMTLVCAENQQISGFTAWYVGGGITTECAVVRIGGDVRNYGTLGTPRGEKPYEYYGIGDRRTNCKDLSVDFDFVGDRNFYSSRSVRHPYPYNDNFIPNGNAHGVWINYDEVNESEYSSAHFIKIRGFWDSINTGIKINWKPESYQAMNTFDINVTIWGARQFCNIKGVDFSTIKIMGQEQTMLDWNPNDILYETSNRLDYEEFTVPLWEVQGSSLHSNIFVYDVFKDDGSGNEWLNGVHNLNGDYYVNKLDVQGYFTILDYGGGDNIELSNTNLNTSTLVTHTYDRFIDNTP